MRVFLHCFIFIASLFLISHTAICKNTALLIGIDQYERLNTDTSNFNRQFNNLEGALNDVNSVASLLVNRFDFESKNIFKICDTAASKNVIIQALQNNLNNLSKDDVFFFYYAGHGSRVKNSKASDGTGYDQTLVAADGNDIRSKELNVIFNKFQQKGVRLILIFDCCHSTSITRGSILSNLNKLRSLPLNSSYDALDSTVPYLLENDGTIIISSAQRDQGAVEMYLRDEKVVHGVFTAALTRALSNSSINENLTELFSRVRSIMISLIGSIQEPSLAANPKALKQPIFQSSFEGNQKIQTSIPISAILKDEIILEGGTELGFFPGTILFAKSDSSIRLNIIESTIGRCVAVPENSFSITNLKIGEIFYVHTYTFPAKGALAIWKSEHNTNNITNELKLLTEILAANKIQFSINGLIEKDENMIIYYNANWALLAGGVLKTIEINQHDANKFLVNYSGKKIKIYLPFKENISKNIDSIFINKNTKYRFTSNYEEAHYWIVGEETAKGINCQLISAFKNDTNLTLPISSKLFNISNPPGLGIDSLKQFIEYCAQLYKWSSLITEHAKPPISMAFMRHKNQKDSTIIISKDIVFENELLSPIFLVSKDEIQSLVNYPRYMYIFNINANGQVSLIFPHLNSGNDRALLNYSATKSFENYMYLESKKTFKIVSPFGIDNFFLLTSELPLPLSLFDSNSRSMESTVSLNNNQELLNLINSQNQNRAYIAYPSNLKWSLESFQINSRAQ